MFWFKFFERCSVFTIAGLIGVIGKSKYTHKQNPYYKFG